jgi:hypothetical protein
MPSQPCERCCRGGRCEGGEKAGISLLQQKAPGGRAIVAIDARQAIGDVGGRRWFRRQLRIAMIRLASLSALWLLAGCAGDILDDIEDRSFDAAADKLSAYCARNASQGLFRQRSRIEVRREIRQRGTDGPPPPDPVPEGLDEQTAQGDGPVLMIWCRGETNGQGVPFAVPDAVWRNMIRDWED